MDLDFVRPDLRAIDRSAADVVACSLWEDIRPMGGLAALVDFRLAGRLSQFAARGELQGSMGEALLYPPRPKLAQEKLVVFGLGSSKAFDDEAYERAIVRVLRTLGGLGARRAVLELPGRGGDAIAPERAAELLFSAYAAEESSLHLYVVEEEEAKRRILARIQDEKKRARRVV